LEGLWVTKSEELARLEGISHVRNQLLIHSQEEDPVTDLSALRCLETVGTNFELYNTHETNLEDLSKLSSVGEDLLISGNRQLTNLTGLEALTNVTGLVRVSSNDSLVDLTGLNNLSTIGGTLGIHENASLSSLAGLEGVVSIGANVAIWRNPELPRCLIEEWAEGVQIGVESEITSFDDGNNAHDSACRE